MRLFHFLSLLLLVVSGCASVENRTLSEIPSCAENIPKSAEEIRERQLLMQENLEDFRGHAAKVKGEIKKAWKWQGSIPAQPTLVRAQFSKSGAVLCASIMKGSGDPFFDQSVLNSFNEVRVIPAPPVHIETLFEEIIFNFDGHDL